MLLYLLTLLKTKYPSSIVVFRVKEVKMDVLPSGGIFRELQVVHDTGYFPTSDGQPSFEEDWHQVSRDTRHMLPGT